jgi:hypothetical protein
LYLQDKLYDEDDINPVETVYVDTVDTDPYSVSDILQTDGA